MTNKQTIILEDEESLNTKCLHLDIDGHPAFVRTNGNLTAAQQASLEEEITGFVRKWKAGELDD